uniref:Uncharacterized protein n=1 Tax=Panagrellus redivivus TaxID=6233 RepID=A0A7E4V5Q3_PANRE
MAKLVSIIFTLFAAVLFLAASTTTVAAEHPHLLERRQDFDTLVSELRSKGSRMRFGKRGYNAPQQETPFLYYFAMPEAGPN